MSFKASILNWNQLTESERQRVYSRPALDGGAHSKAVQEIIDQVRTNGDQALRNFSQKFDRVDLKELVVSAQEIEDAYLKIGEYELAAIKKAQANIHKFHLKQLPQAIEVETTEGVICRRESRPIDRVGLYIPGGTAPLLSTVLMLAIPAEIVGCPLRVMATPPQKDGSVNPYILVAADLCGVDEIYKVGGAHAVAALAYGSETVKKVDKIFGPGNTWVTLAKQIVSEDASGAACDMPAGPSEVLVIADQETDANLAAIDLLSQAEHGADSQAVLVCTSQDKIEQVIQAIDQLLTELPRAELAKKALAHSLFIKVDNLDEAISVSNHYAPEHLIIQTKDPKTACPKITNAGSVFLGPWTPESMGDYASGTNHVLPTYGWARTFSGVSIESFIKQITFQEVTANGLKNLGPTVEVLAAIEGLDAHKKAVSLRLKKLEESL